MEPLTKYCADCDFAPNPRSAICQQCLADIRTEQVETNMADPAYIADLMGQYGPD